MKSITSKISTFLAATVLASTAQANLITNGSFEDEAVSDGTWRWFIADDVNGWQGSNIEIWDDLRSDVQAYEGEQHAELNAHPYTGQSFSIFQNFETVAGQSYDLSFAYRARQSDQEMFQVTVGDQSGDLLSTIVSDHTTSEWSLFTTSFIGTGNTTTLTFTSIIPSAGTVGNFIDDVKVVASVPEASSIALFGLGIAGLMISRRRQK